MHKIKITPEAIQRGQEQVEKEGERRFDAAVAMDKALRSILEWAKEQGIGIPTRCGHYRALADWLDAKGGGE